MHIKLLPLTLVSVFILNSYAKGNESTHQEVRDVLKRFNQGKDISVNLETIPKKEGKDVYEVIINDGNLLIKGSSGIAQCRAFYDYVKKKGYGQFSWSGSRLDIPRTWTGSYTHKVESPFELHYYFNTCTFGYTMPYWKWDRWEKEIDWMALHGVNFPLALVANEAISKRVWNKLGLTDTEIESYFSGPAYLPWMRMGNLCSQNGPLNDTWHNSQIALQHKILKRMKALGIKPICPGFAGFVPQEMQRIYPEVKLIQSNWVGGYKNWIIDPNDPLFSKVGKMFIEEWEKEFGPNDHYLIDTFNEVELELPEKNTPERDELFTHFGENVFKGLHEANPKAVWVMQGWMFGFQRHVWDTKTMQALFKKVPDDKLIILDLAVDYNNLIWGQGNNCDAYDGFYGKPWVYSVIPNMGGRTSVSSPIDFYIKGHYNALNSPKKGNIIGYGCAPEGIENNEPIFELVMDIGWSQDEINLERWYQEYSQARYGKTSEKLMKAWKLIKSTAFSGLRGGTHGWQFRPGAGGANKIEPDFFKGVELFLSCSDELKDSPLYVADVAELVTLAAGFKVDLLIEHLQKSYLFEEKDQSKHIGEIIIQTLRDMDTLLESHPNLRMEKWIEQARSYGESEALKKQYEIDSKRILTVWGPSLQEYAARIWSGLIRDYYIPRWEIYLHNKESGQNVDIAQWEQDWVTTEGLSPAIKSDDPIGLAHQLFAHINQIQPINHDQTQGDLIATWTPADISTIEKEVSWTIPVDKANKAKFLTFTYKKGEHRLNISEVSLEIEGKTICTVKQKGFTGHVHEKNVYKLTIPSDVKANNSAKIKAKIASDGGSDSYGEVRLILNN